MMCSSPVRGTLKYVTKYICIGSFLSCDHVSFDHNFMYHVINYYVSCDQLPCTYVISFSVIICRAQ